MVLYKYATIIVVIKKTFTRQWNVDLIHCLQEGNFVVDLLAKLRNQNGVGFQVYEHASTSLALLQDVDAKGVIYQSLQLVFCFLIFSLSCFSPLTKKFTLCNLVRFLQQDLKIKSNCKKYVVFQVYDFCGFWFNRFIQNKHVMSSSFIVFDF